MWIELFREKHNSTTKSLSNQPILAKEGSVPSIDQSTVSIRFIGEGLNPDEISKRLLLTESVRPIVKTKGKRTIVWSVGYPEADPDELGRKIEILLDWFTKDITIWKEIAGIYKGEIFCGLFLDGWNRGFELSIELLRAISDRDLSIGFDIYSPTDLLDEKKRV